MNFDNLLQYYKLNRFSIHKYLSFDQIKAFVKQIRSRAVTNQITFFSRISPFFLHACATCSVLHEYNQYAPATFHQVVKSRGFLTPNQHLKRFLPNSKGGSRCDKLNTQGCGSVFFLDRIQIFVWSDSVKYFFSRFGSGYDSGQSFLEN